MSAFPSNRYRIHGLLVESEIPLLAQEPEQDEDGRSRTRRFGNGRHPAPDYRVVAGEPADCPHSPPQGRLLAELCYDGYGFWATEARHHPNIWLLRYAGICDVTIDRGRRVITVCRSPQADPGLIPIFVEGNVLAHALTAEDLLTLHASAVEVGGSGLAILGPSGAGKSTLAAVFCGMGARLIADDVLRVDPTTSGAICFPGTQGLRLRPAARSLGSGSEAAAVEETADGRTRVLPTRCVSAPLKLRAALVPELSREAERLEVTRLGARDGLTELLRHPRLAAWRAQEPIARLFRLTAEVAPTITVYRATVPWGSYFQPGFAEELLASIGNGATSGRAAAERDAALASDP